jgi:hypothetical protein
MKIITREAAAAGGLNKYYTGKLCKHGHDSERWVLNCGCVQCTIESTYRNRKGVAEIMKAAQRSGA